MTEQPTFFTVVCDLRALVADGADDGIDPDSVPVSATVTFKPLIETGDIILATNAAPRPTGFVAAPVVATIASDGLLKLRPTPANGYPYTPVRLLASSPLLELTAPLAYSVTFSDVKWNNGTQFGSIKGFTFEAPDADVELNLITVARAPGQQATGITKIAPTAVRFDDGSLIFSFAGDDLPEPLPLADITGPQGEAATITVGSVATGTAGSSASVTNSGTANDAVLDFTIPEGEPATVEVGDVSTVTPADPATVTNTGTARNAVFDFEIPQGAAATIAVGDVTAVAPGSPATVTNTGTTADAVFDFEIPQGAAATIAVGSVATGTAGTNASVTNTGDTSAAVFDFTIPRGDKGDAATITVGDVTTLAPGSSATVTNTGTSGDAVLEFGLPRGDVGAQGPQGPQGLQGVPGVSLDIEGTVATVSALPSSPPAGTAYVVADVGLLFYFDGTEWSDGVPFVGPAGPTGAQGIQGIQGEVGPTGATGPTGAQGASGTAATIEVGTVTTGDPGTNASVTNTGTTTAAVFAFQIPRGDVGASGGTGGVGATGPQGIQGPMGPTGPAGQAANILGELGSYSALPATAADGDAYLLPTGKLYIYDSVNGWPADGSGVQFVGPAGPVGATGASGGTGGVGATGEQGIQGPTGPAGASGLTGASGAVGATGGTGGVGATGAPGTTTWSGITDKPAVIAAGVDAAAARNAIDAEYTGNRGVANGYASLDSSGLVPSSQLPSFVDDVVEAANLAAFPATGTAGKIYTALDTNKVYRWGGSTYVEISASPGSTDAVPEGSSNLYYTVARADGRIAAAVGSTVQAYSPTLTNYAGKSAPSGAVVGTTDAQALTNKDLTAGTNTFPTFNQNTTGNAATATRLETARTINGVSFDGTANITVPAGIQRVVQTITAPTTLASAANTDYVYFLSTAQVGSADSSYSDVVALLYGDGANNSTTITDSSSLASNWTANAGAKLSTAQKKFGTASIVLAAGDSVTSTAATSNFALPGDLTIEFWFFPVQPASGSGSFSLVSGTFPTIYGEYSVGGYRTVVLNTATALFGDFNWDQWNHVAVTRSGSTMRLFINGVQADSLGSNTRTVSTSFSAGQVTIGGASNIATRYIDDFRITKGVARYTSGFSVPTAALPGQALFEFGTPTLPTAVGNTNQYTLKNITSSIINPLTTSSQTIDGASTTTADSAFNTNVALLRGDGANNSTSIIDSSGSATAWSVSGNARISTAEKRFGTGSIYFDGTSNTKISPPSATPYAFGTDDFCIEFWLFVSVSAAVYYYDSRPNGGGGSYIALFSAGGGNVSMLVNNSTVISSGNFSANTWVHFALCRSGTTTRMFLNGTQTGSSYTDTNNYLCAAGGPVIGMDALNQYRLNGYMDEIRISRGAGAGRYTSNFSAPTAEFPGAAGGTMAAGSLMRLISDGSNWRTV